MTISIPTPILDALSAVKDDDGIRNYCLSRHSTPCRRQGPPQILSNLTAGQNKMPSPFHISSPPENTPSPLPPLPLGSESLDHPPDQRRRSDFDVRDSVVAAVLPPFQIRSAVAAAGAIGGRGDVGGGDRTGGGGRGVLRREVRFAADGTPVPHEQPPRDALLVEHVAADDGGAPPARAAAPAAVGAPRGVIAHLELAQAYVALLAVRRNDRREGDAAAAAAGVGGRRRRRAGPPGRSAAGAPDRRRAAAGVPARRRRGGAAQRLGVMGSPEAAAVQRVGVPPRGGQGRPRRISRRRRPRRRGTRAARRRVRRRRRR